jgi:glucan 1,3-beta-glucosidase
MKIPRRSFLKNALGGALALSAMRPGLALAQAASVAGRGELLPLPDKFRGVNLGAWLLLERWMVPELFQGSEAVDEYTFCQALGRQARARMDRHRETFITAEDFRWIKKCGLNAVRLPVGYWALEAPEPFVEHARFIEFALEQCRANGLKLLLDLHGAPGSQNGNDHSGRRGPIGWPGDPQNIRETVRILESFAQKFGRHPALWGIELLNEPDRAIPLEILQPFYREASARMRPHLAPGAVIAFHDSFRPRVWQDFLAAPDQRGTILDAHLYQCFGEPALSRSAAGQLNAALNQKETLDAMQQNSQPVIIGEWSLSLPRRAMAGLTPVQVESVQRAYAAIQLLNFESTRGWFFWSYKLSAASEWNFRYCVERGWLPARFGA